MALPDEHRQFRTLVTALFALEGRVNDFLPDGRGDLTVYRWRPRHVPDLPALWNWPGSAPLEHLDQANHEERFGISVFVGVEHSDADEEMEALEDYVDAARYVLDRGLWRNPPLDDAATRAWRVGLRPSVQSFGRKTQGGGDIDVLCVEMPLALYVNRQINPNSTL